MQFVISNRYKPSELADKILINNQFRLEREEKKEKQEFLVVLSFFN